MRGRTSAPRIASGRLAGRHLEVAAGIRPSSRKLREALFSIWSAELADARWLDLFAGSGAVGIEAWSRGAGAVTLVESDRGALRALRRNLALCEEERKAPTLLGEGVAAAMARLRQRRACFDLIFADPPYEQVLGGPFFASAAGVAAPSARLAIEHRAGVELDAAAAGWRRGSQRRYGDSALTLYERDAG